MGFIEKKDPLVLNIKLTSKGRELISKGQLNFKYYGIGDSEIDYNYNNLTNFDPFFSSILKPADKNPQQLSFLLRNVDSNNLNEINNVPTTTTIIENQISSVGFFNESTTEFLTDGDHVKQPDAMVKISGVTGGTRLEINKAPTYISNVTEPAENDLLLVKWTNPQSIDTTGYTLNKSNPTPYLMYKIQNIISGSLSSDNLVVEVDRELPDFTLITGNSNIVAGAMFYYNFINFTGETQYSTDFANDSLISFLENTQSPTVRFPFWNLSIIFTENIVGIQDGDKEYGDFNTKSYGGFVSYIQNQAPVYKKLGVIHYTNNSISNTYAEGFYGDPNNIEDINKIPTLEIPTIMWHKSSGTTLGLTLKARGGLKYLSGITKSLNTRYFNLADTNGNVVGKVFYDLQLFVIEDQELLFAMSYKSNRSWTLPNFGVDINANVTFGCPQANITFDLSSNSPSTINGNDGEIIIENIDGYVGNPAEDNLVLEIYSGTTGSTGNKIYFNTIYNNNVTITKDDVVGNIINDSTYFVSIIDLAAPNSKITKQIIINDPVASIQEYDVNTTYSTLQSYFSITPLSVSNPGLVRLQHSNIGNPIGDVYLTIVETGSTNNNTTLNSRTEGVTANDAFSKWVLIPEGGFLELSAFTFKKPYVFYLRDVIDNSGSFTDNITNNDVIDTQVWSYYVAVGSPFNTNIASVNITYGQDSGGNYALISNYLTGTNPSINPIIGQIEVGYFVSGDIVRNWVNAPNNGSQIKLYYDVTTPIFSLRQRYDYIITHKINIGN